MAHFRDISGWIRPVPPKTSQKIELKKWGPRLLALVSKLENDGWSLVSGKK